MNEVVSPEYEKAKGIFQNFMGMVGKNVSWPTKDLVRYFTDQFTGVLDSLYEEQVCLVTALRMKNERLRELKVGVSEADEWAELEEIQK